MLGLKDEVRPNFLIVGAARSGTTSLYYWLKQHPEVFMPDIKEPSYFVHGYGISDWRKYLSLFEPGRGKKVIGEASTAYLAAPESPRWIRDVLGNIKIIILLRNPIERAYSLYCWMVMEGYEWLPTFEKALEEEDRRFQDEPFRRSNPEYFWDYMYFRSGLYYDQVKRYIETFGSNSVKTFLFEDLTRSPEKLYSDVCRFLEVSDNYHPHFIPQNPSKIPRFIRLQYLFRQAPKLVPKLPGVFRKVSRPVIWRLVPLMMSLNKKAGCRVEISPELRNRLREMYREEILRLSELIGRDLSEWLR